MSITHKAAKALECETTTTAASRSVRSTTQSGMRLAVRSKDSTSSESEPGKLKRQPTTEESTWGWAYRMTWDSEHGFRLRG